MFKKMFLATLVTMLLVGVSVSTAAAQRSLKTLNVSSQKIPLQVVYKACQKVQERKAISFEKAYVSYKTGRMAIKKVGTGKYVAITHGGDQIIILETNI